MARSHGGVRRVGPARRGPTIAPPCPRGAAGRGLTGYAESNATACLSVASVGQGAGGALPGDGPHPPRSCWPCRDGPGSFACVRRLRDWRLLATALGFSIGTANPASVLAHALAHHRDAHQTMRHAGSLEAHDGPAELATRGHAGSHQHVRLDQATRTSTSFPLLGLAVTATAADLDLTLTERVGDVPAASAPGPDPPGDDPPRLRAPPLH